MNNKSKINRILRTLVCTVVSILYIGTFCDVVNAAEPDVDYILGRPMTEEEINEQKSLEPQEMTLMPSEGSIETYEPPFMMFGLGENLPESYDSRDVDGNCYITSVKNQSPYNNCWSFASLASFESSLIKKGYADNSVDLSEAHLTYYVAHTGYDELGNTLNDYINGTPNWHNGGGNYQMATVALSNWKGAALESDYPLHVDDPFSSMTATDSYSHDVYTLKNVYATPTSDRDTVKKLIMEYGAAYTEMCYKDTYYNYSTGAYYCDSSLAGNHAVTIVGWDDNYSINNFRSGCKPSSKGAWIIKNSWGPYWGDDGYFYLSYEDLPSKNLYTAVFVGGPKDSECNNYYYSGGAPVYYTFLHGVAECYTAKGNEGGDETIEGAGIFLASSSVEYVVKVYKIDNPNIINFANMTPVVTESGVSSYSGYYVHEFDEKITVSAGDTFAVLFNFADSTGIYYDCEYTEGSWTAVYTSHDDVKSKQAFYTLYSGYDRYRDFATTYKGTPRMNIFTRDSSESKATVKSANLNTQGSIILNLYVNVPKRFANSGAYAVIDGDTANPVYINNSVLTGGSGTDSGMEYAECVFSASRPAKGLYDEMSLQLYDKNGSEIYFSNNNGIVFNYSVINYIDDVNAGSEASDALRNYVKSLRAYGCSAQEYFDYETERLGSYNVPTITNDRINPYVKEIMGTIPAGLEYAGTSLVLKDNVTIRHYFRLKGNHSMSEYDFAFYRINDDSTMTLLAEGMEPADNDGLYSLEVRNIPPIMFKTSYVLTINGSETYGIKYSVNSYAWDVLNKSSNDKLKKLVKTLVGYGDSAEVYFDSVNE